ncbi:MULTISPECIES: glycine hydroxymethyltransferase [unclassified Pseudomonas]|uniref:glycine hydroxymethyltransferase n=1 Tax=unclassified Pseudomonas TaxID=196821 RepID=UPI0021BB15BE|nr:MULTISPECIES: glycine hydroxymethyltransferase [unclassified Pseudomonas]MCT8167012.1 glycine hydroxymethyltransferase [Pseudomonas sp. HD6422]MCT8186001.1 glycine hydroxymethyltransferase [Pseudomonas sp. HD6421]
MARAQNDEALMAAARERTRQLSEERLVLYAGANLPSAEVIAAYAPGLSAYPAMGPSFFKEQPDTALVSRLEHRVEALACDVFGAAWAQVRLPSCTLANLAVFHSFAAPGDLLLAPSAAHGGHLSQRRGGTPELAGLRVEDLPFDTQGCQLDGRRAAALVLQRQPKLVMLGRSVLLAPDDIDEVVRAAQAVGALTIFDASHVSGLIAGKVFPNPFEAGVDIITTSTYKTLPGLPQGLVLGREPEHGAKLRSLLDRAFLANYDAGRLPCLVQLLDEVKLGGVDYARRIIRNTVALAEALRDQGLPVMVGATAQQATHQLLIALGHAADPRAVMQQLERSGIVVGTCADPSRPGEHALRLGTQVLTRLGLEPRDMADIAALLRRVLAGQSDGGAEVKALLARYHSPRP